MKLRTILSQVTFLLLLVFVGGVAAQSPNSDGIGDLIVALCELCCLCLACCSDLAAAEEREQRLREHVTATSNVRYYNISIDDSAGTYPQQLMVNQQPVLEMQVPVTDSVPVMASAPTFSSSADEEKYPNTPPPSYDESVLPLKSAKI